MSSYRLGHFVEAMEWAEKTLKGPIIYPNAHAYAILAMSHWQLGQKEAARRMLAKGDSLTPSILHSHEAVDLGDSLRSRGSEAGGFRWTGLQPDPARITDRPQSDNNP